MWGSLTTPIRRYLNMQISGAVDGGEDFFKLGLIPSRFINNRWFLCRPHCMKRQISCGQPWQCKEWALTMNWNQTFYNLSYPFLKGFDLAHPASKETMKSRCLVPCKSIMVNAFSYADVTTWTFQHTYSQNSNKKNAQPQGPFVEWIGLI